MKARHLGSLTALTLLGAFVSPHSLQAAEAPSIGGGYTNVTYRSAHALNAI